jgi:hypothetical protein
LLLKGPPLGDDLINDPSEPSQTGCDGCSKDCSILAVDELAHEDSTTDAGDESVARSTRTSPATKSKRHYEEE